MSVRSLRVALLLAVLAVPMVSACARTVPQAAAQTAATPQRTAQDFYRWYLGLVAAEKEPSDDPATYARYVAPTLRAAIARQQASEEGIDADPFLKAQDTLESWPLHVDARPMGVATTRVARVAVTLGTRKEAWRLSLTMQRQGDRWQVAGVTHP